MTKKRKKRRGRRIGLTIFLVLVLLILMAAAGSLIWYKRAMSPVGTAEETAEVTVEAGQTYKDLLDQLETDGLIHSRLAAQIYAKMHDDNQVYEGTFLVNKGMTTPEILQYLNNPENIELSYAVVTIPEGYWAKQIAAVLAQHFPEYTAEQFLDLWNDDSYIEGLKQDYSFLDPAVLEDDDYFVELEGYLFPETYYIDYGSTMDQITRVFLDQFEKFYEENRQAIEDSGMSVQELVTLASIVQFESGSAADMPDIARVFLNRLDQDMMLQSSVTVCYALYDDYKSAEDCETNTGVDSPYNTYMYPGLPIGPILNPGAEAMDAVLHPADNDYLYFVADIHGDGSVHYASTLEEHEANIDRFNLRITDGSYQTADPESTDTGNGEQAADQA